MKVRMNSDPVATSCRACATLLAIASIQAPGTGQAPETRAAHRKLSHPSTGPYPGIREFELADQGRRAVFFQDGELFSVPVDGSTLPILLSSGQGGIVDSAVGGSVSYFHLGDGGRWAVYRMNAAAPELWSVPVDGSRPPLRLDQGTYSVEYFDTSSGSDQVLYSGNDVSVAFEALYSVPIDGSQPPTRVYGPPANSGVGGFEFGPVGSTFAFYGYEGGGIRLFTHPGSLVPISGIDYAGGGTGMSSAAFSPDGSHVLHTAQAGTTLDKELYVSPIDGSLPPRLLATATAGKTLYYAQFSPDEQRVLYTQGSTTAPLEIYSVPADGSSPPVRLFQGTSSLGFATWPFDQEDDAVLFRGPRGSAAFDLFATRTDGTSAPLRLSRGTGTVAPEFALHPDSSRVVYLADHDRTGVQELHSVPSDGSSPAIELNASLDGFPFGQRRVGSFQLQPGGDLVVYDSNQELAYRTELFAVPVDGGLESWRVSVTLPGATAITQYRITPDGKTAVYLIQQDATLSPELYASPLRPKFRRGPR